MGNVNFRVSRVVFFGGLKVWFNGFCRLLYVVCPISFGLGHAVILSSIIRIDEID